MFDNLFFLKGPIGAAAALLATLALFAAPAMSSVCPLGGGPRLRM